MREKKSYLTLLSIFVASFVSQPPEIVIGLLLVDIASTFNVHVGIMGQIRTFAALMTVLTALVLGVISLKYNYKSLLLVGIGFLGFSAIGSYYAPNYVSMILTYSFAGIGLALIRPMSMAIIGKILREDQRSGAIGFFFSGNAMSFIIGGPIMVIIASNLGWRFVFLIYILPLTLIGVLIVYFGIQKEIPLSDQHHSEENQFFDGVRNAISNQSALSCLFGNFLAYSGWQMSLSYGVAFFREIFNVSVGWSSMFLTSLASSYIIGALLVGKIINRFGRKTVTLISFILLGFACITYLNSPLLSASIIIYIMIGIIRSSGSTSSNSLALEQLPTYRGPMMSLNAAAEYMGSMIGAGLGGYILIKSSYGSLGLIAGVLFLLSAVTFYLKVKDPHMR